jgi:hypothetical protein
MFFFLDAPQILHRRGRPKMVYSSESMTNKNGVEVNHFEPVRWTELCVGHPGKKTSPGPPHHNYQVDPPAA